MTKRNSPASNHIPLGFNQAIDVLLSVEGKPVHQAQSVLNAVASLSPGSNAKLALKRQGQDVELSVTVGKRPRPQVRAE
jgi:S1-C subfamily serine protease